MTAEMKRGCDRFRNLLTFLGRRLPITIIKHIFLLHKFTFIFLNTSKNTSKIFRCPLGWVTPFSAGARGEVGLSAYSSIEGAHLRLHVASLFNSIPAECT